MPGLDSEVVEGCQRRDVQDAFPLSEQICDELGLYDALSVDQGAMRRFASVVERGYQGCPYHNKLHAASVTLALFQIIVASGVHKSPAAGCDS